MLESPEIAALLRAIANVIEKSDSQAVKRLTAELAKSAKLQQKHHDQNIDIAFETALDNLTEQLVKFDNRESGLDFLKKARLTKRQLSAIGKSNKIYMAKSDTASIMEDKIVEALLGSKLSSKAVRGK